ncbi:MAG: hypothetical protein WDO70_02095 [Alphaproteobacteria bacterium]
MKYRLFLLACAFLAAMPGQSRADDCADFPAMLESCSPYQCSFVHPFTRQAMEKNIRGENNGKCLYTEQMPGGGRLECAYTPEMRQAVTEELRNYASGKPISGKTHGTASASGSNIQSTYVMDGKEYPSAMQQALNEGQCVTTGYK